MPLRADAALAITLSKPYNISISSAKRSAKVLFPCHAHLIEGGVKSGPHAANKNDSPTWPKNPCLEVASSRVLIVREAAASINRQNLGDHVDHPQISGDRLTFSIRKTLSEELTFFFVDFLLGGALDMLVSDEDVWVTGQDELFKKRSAIRSCPHGVCRRLCSLFPCLAGKSCCCYILG